MVDMNAPPWRRKMWPHPVALGCGRGSSCVLSQGVPELPLVQRLWGRPSCRAATPRPLSLCSKADVVLTSLLPPRRRLPPRRARLASPTGRHEAGAREAGSPAALGTGRVGRERASWFGGAALRDARHSAVPKSPGAGLHVPAAGWGPPCAPGRPACACMCVCVDARPRRMALSLVVPTGWGGGKAFCSSLNTALKISVIQNFS